MIVPRIIP